MVSNIDAAKNAGSAILAYTNQMVEDMQNAFVGQPTRAYALVA